MTNADVLARQAWRYPVHLIDVMWLANGTRVTIRPTLPQDLELQHGFFRALSVASRYNRFMTHVSELPCRLAERFANIDYHDHVALLAATFDAAGRETMIAEARYVRDDPTGCELAIAVGDPWQRYGVASRLVALLERQAVESGVATMRAETLISNRAMRGLAESHGFAVTPCPGDPHLVRLEKALPTRLTTTPDVPWAA